VLWVDRGVGRFELCRVGSLVMATRGQYVPTDQAAERAVAAALLVDTRAYDEVVLRIVPEDMHDRLARAVFEAAIVCEASGRPIDQVTVADELNRRGVLPDFNVAVALSGLVESGAFATAHVATHAQIVFEKSKLRRVIAAGNDMVKSAMEAEANVDEVVSDAETAVFALGERRDKGSLVSLAEVVPPTIEEIIANRGRVLLGHSTGFSELDNLTGGFQGGQLIVLAARPGVGKSALALQMASHVALTSGTTVAFLSYEMSRTELTMRMISSMAGFSVSRMSSIGRALVEDEDTRLAEAGVRLSQIPLHIDDTPPRTISGVRSLMRAFARRNEVGMVVVDYMQLMESDRRSGAMRAEEVSDISRGLKRLASELNVPVLALSQLNREVEKRENKRPLLSDLRESGSIEQDASTVLMLYREGRENGKPDDNATEIIIAKQRSGPSSMAIPCEYESATTKFIDTKKPARPLVSRGYQSGVSIGHTGRERPF
jgi:replicative DNA helicase